MHWSGNEPGTTGELLLLLLLLLLHKQPASWIFSKLVH
jgi:hypothetical protein